MWGRDFWKRLRLSKITSVCRCWHVLQFAACCRCYDMLWPQVWLLPTAWHSIGQLFAIYLCPVIQVQWLSSTWINLVCNASWCQMIRNLESKKNQLQSPFSWFHSTTSLLFSWFFKPNWISRCQDPPGGLDDYRRRWQHSIWGRECAIARWALDWDLSFCNPPKIVFFNCFLKNLDVFTMFYMFAMKSASRHLWTYGFVEVWCLLTQFRLAPSRRMQFFWGPESRRGKGVRDVSGRFVL